MGERIWHLTRRQADVFEVIAGSRDANGISPTFQEIGDALGISKVTAFEHVAELVRKGWIEREENGKSRALVSVPAYPSWTAEQIREAVGVHLINCRGYCDNDAVVVADAVCAALAEEEAPE